MYKTWGPHLGLMFVKKELQNKWRINLIFINKDDDRCNLTPAGPDHAQIASAAGIADYFDAVHDHHFEKLIQ